LGSGLYHQARIAAQRAEYHGQPRALILKANLSFGVAGTRQARYQIVPAHAYEFFHRSVLLDHVDFGTGLLVHDEGVIATGPMEKRTGGVVGLNLRAGLDAHSALSAGNL